MTACDVIGVIRGVRQRNVRHAVVNFEVNVTVYR